MSSQHLLNPNYHLSSLTWTTGSRCTRPSHKKQEIKELGCFLGDKLKDQNMANQKKDGHLHSEEQNGAPRRTQTDVIEWMSISKEKIPSREQLVSQGGDAEKQRQRAQKFQSVTITSEVAQSCPAPWTIAYQAPPSMGFSRQEYWSGLPLSPVQF